MPVSSWAVFLLVLRNVGKITITTLKGLCKIWGKGRAEYVHFGQGHSE